MATKTFKIGLSNTDKQNMAQDVYERLINMCFDAYDSANTYNEGDFVVYENPTDTFKLYKCNSDNVTGAWDSTKWQLATFQDLVDDIEGAVAFVNDKANVDGNYPTLTAGQSDQLNSTIKVEDKVPYLFRTTGGSADVGNRAEIEITGGSIVWNQLVQNGNFASTDGWVVGSGATFSTSDNIGTITLTATGTTKLLRQEGIKAYKTNTIYLYLSYVKAPISLSVSYNQSGDNFGEKTISANTWTLLSYIGLRKNEYDNIGWRFDISEMQINDTIQVKDFMCIDLTQMFGSTIADYLATLTTEQAVAWFKHYFPKDYYHYNAGTPLSVKLLSHDTVGFNAYNNQIGQAELLGGKQYQITGTYTSVSYEDVNGNSETLSIDGNGLFTPTNNGTLTVVGGNATDTCVHLVWSGYRNGEYEAYEKHSYPLDTTIELRGIPKLDSNNNLYYDGDIYKSDGTVTRRYAIVDLGTLSWVEYATGAWYSDSLMSLIKATNDIYANPNIIAQRYIAESRYNLANGIAIEPLTSSYAGRLRVVSSSTPSGYLIYELETSTTETADTFQSPQIVNDFGTEEYVVPLQATDVKVPVGHTTLYPANLRDKLQRLPDMPQNEGYYIVHYSSRQCEFYGLSTWLSANGYAKLTDLSGYDDTKTQTLKNVNGTLTWVDDE